MSKSGTQSKIGKKLKRTEHKVFIALIWTAVVFICGVYASTRKKK